MPKPETVPNQTKAGGTVTHEEFLSSNAQAVEIFAHLEAMKNTNIVKKAKVVAGLEKRAAEVMLNDDLTPRMKTATEPMLARARVTVLFNDGTKETFRSDHAMYEKALDLNAGASVMLIGRVMPAAQKRSGDYGDYAVTTETIVWDEITVIFDASKYAPVGVA